MACPDADEIVAYAQGHAGAALRERIAAHVDACEVCVGLVAEAARQEATPAPAEGEAPTRGSTLGRYLVLELVGEGGLGRVYAAYDPELDRRIAIKLIEPRAALDRDDLRVRLVREAQALAKVRHPNVVAVYDVGVVASQVFIAMELVEGSTLGAWLHAEPRGWSEIRDVFVAAARGLAAVHDAGLVHRDVKPSNILVGHDGRVQIADFGLARALGHDVVADRGPGVPPRASTLDASLTASGAVIGTPAYMPPEQHRGGPVDVRADQFGLGVALFEALHGVRPFAGTTSEQLHRAAATGTVVAVEGGRAPGWLRRVALRAIAADPADRFASMPALVAAMQHDRRARRWRAAVASVGLVIGGGALWGLVIGPALAPEPSALAAVDALVHEARAAAAQTHFVHPPTDAPRQPTAYTKVLELEAHTGPAAAVADERAGALREEFADTLVRLGDRFWELDGGGPFAAEYYAAALVFADDHPRALARAGVSIAAVVALRERAAGLSFGPPELQAVAPVLALADDDARARDERIEEAYARAPEPPAAITAALEQVLGEAGRAAVARGRDRRPSTETTASPIAAAATPVAPATTESSSTTVPRASSTPPQPVAARAGPRADAGAHVAAGRDALRRGDLDVAAAAFHRALAADRTEVRALTGLAEVAFQRRAYESAAEFLERATGLAPRDAAIHLDLGDVYFKVLRYDDARAQYDLAASLGHAAAKRRLARLDARLGGER